MKQHNQCKPSEAMKLGKYVLNKLADEVVEDMIKDLRTYKTLHCIYICYIEIVFYSLMSGIICYRGNTSFNHYQIIITSRTSHQSSSCYHFKINLV